MIRSDEIDSTRVPQFSTKVKRAIENAYKQHDHKLRIAVQFSSSSGLDFVPRFARETMEKEGMFFTHIDWQATDEHGITYMSSQSILNALVDSKNILEITLRLPKTHRLDLDPRLEEVCRYNRKEATRLAQRLIENPQSVSGTQDGTAVFERLSAIVEVATTDLGYSPYEVARMIKELRKTHNPDNPSLHVPACLPQIPDVPVRITAREALLSIHDKLTRPY